jgi:hypothetical protein
MTKTALWFALAFVGACGAPYDRYDIRRLAPGGSLASPTTMLDVIVEDEHGNPDAPSVEPVDDARVEVSIDGAAPFSVPSVGDGLYQIAMRPGSGTYAVTVDGAELVRAELRQPVEMLARASGDGSMMHLEWSAGDPGGWIEYVTTDEGVKPGSESIDVAVEPGKPYHFAAVQDVGGSAAGSRHAVDVLVAVGFDYTR